MLKPGAFINERYEIVDKVGSGGMADVYKAKDHKLNRFVAIKVLKAGFNEDKNFVNKFREEAQACAGLSHANIVNIYDVGNEEDIHYIVMELVEGITLKNYIERKGKLEVKEAVSITIQIANGIEVAHNKHIVHRDIKPQNIIISKDGKVKVTDFGIAKAVNSNTITADAVGTVHYISPEQARGGYSDEKSDIYSLGVTMYEMLSGKVPFNSDNNVSVALLHIQSEAIPLREIDPEIPASVERIVQKSMQKKPERRYLSVSDLIIDLKKSIENPNGDFVVIPPTGDLDSPTIAISDEELEIIKNSANQHFKANGEYNDDFLDYDDYPNEEYLEDEYYDEEDDEGFIEEDADEIDPRMDKVVLIGTVVAGIILALVVLFLLSRFFNLFPGRGDDQTTEVESSTESETIEEEPSTEAIESFSMPYVLNLTLNDAKELIEQKSPDIIIKSTEDYSETVGKGLVVEQYPGDGTEITSNTEVRLVISAGKESFKLPNVSNYTEQQAVTILEDAGLSVIRDFRSHDSIDDGKVISTNPEQGSLVVKGDSVTVIVSTGPDISYVIVPKLVGLDINTALHLINSSGLSIGTTAEDVYSDEPAGRVIWQSREQGDEVPEGMSINLIISAKIEPTSPPVTDATEAEAETEAETEANTEPENEVPPVSP